MKEEIKQMLYWGISELPFKLNYQMPHLDFDFNDNNEWFSIHKKWRFTMDEASYNKLMEHDDESVKWSLCINELIHSSNQKNSEFTQNVTVEFGENGLFKFEAKPI